MKNVALIHIEMWNKSIKKQSEKIFCGRSLIFWILDVVTYCGTVDEVFVCTNSDY